MTLTPLQHIFHSRLYFTSGYTSHSYSRAPWQTQARRTPPRRSRVPVPGPGEQTAGVHLGTAGQPESVATPQPDRGGTARPDFRPAAPTRAETRQVGGLIHTLGWTYGGVLTKSPRSDPYRYRPASLKHTGRQAQGRSRQRSDQHFSGESPENTIFQSAASV